MAILTTPVNEQDHKTAADGSAIILLEYGDYECEHCAEAQTFVNQLLEEHEVQFTYRHFPLNDIHPMAMIAALAAEAASNQNKFWEMHRLIYENQGNLSANELVEFAVALSLDLAQFAADWKSPASMQKVETDFESGMRSGVTGTPTFFVNGKKLEGYDGSFQSLSQAVKGSLK